MEQVSVFDINKICRVCLEEGILVSIYSQEYAISPLDMIVGCTNVKITDNDELPSSICDNCIYRLGVAYQFKQQCENSDMRLRECLGLESILVDVNLDDANENDDDNKAVHEDAAVKLEKQVLRNIENGHHQNMVSNNDSATQVKDEEIYAAMNAVCEIFGETETQLLHNHHQNQIRQQEHEQQQHHQQHHLHHHQHLNHDGTDSTDNLILINSADVDDDNLMNSTNYLNDDVLGANICDVESLEHEILVNDQNHQQMLSDQLSVENALISDVASAEVDELILKKSEEPSISNEAEKREADVDVSVQSQLNIRPAASQTLENILIVKKKFKSKKTKTKKKKTNKILKSRADLDKFLEQQKTKRKSLKQSTKQELHQQSKADGTKQQKKKKLLLKTPDKCFDCGKTFNYSGYLDAHMRTHTGERPFNCKICKLKFAQAGNLALHMRIHTGERPYQCEICSKLFTTSSNLKAHQRIHSEIRDFKCSQCDRAFKSPTELMSHEGTHTGVKNHVCKACGKAFYKTSYLNVHIRTVHVGEKRHRCSECGKEFSNSSNLTCHFRIHTGEKPFACKHCDAKFNQSSALIRHSKQHTHSSQKSVKQTNQQKRNSLKSTVTVIDEEQQLPHSQQQIDPITTTTADATNIILPSLLVPTQQITSVAESTLLPPLPTIITIPSSMYPDFKSNISDITFNSFKNYLPLPLDQQTTSFLDITTTSSSKGGSTSLLDYSKNTYIFNP